MDSYLRMILLAVLPLMVVPRAAADGGVLTLGPGTYLRMGPAGEVRVLDARASRPFVQLLSGSCQLECAGCEESRVSIAFGDVLVTVVAAGEYHFDGSLDRVVVISGKVRVSTRGRRYELSGGEVLVFGDEVKVGRIGPVRARF